MAQEKAPPAPEQQAGTPPTANHDPSFIDIGPGWLYIAPIGTAEPTDPTDASGGWSTTWVELGYTDTGSEFKVAPTTADVMVAETTTPVQTIVTAVKSTLDVAMAQITAWNFQVSQGGGTITSSGGRTFADGTTTSGSPALGSAGTANFTAADVGKSVSGAGIPTGTTILSFQSATSVTMSQNATATASGVSVTLGASFVQFDPPTTGTQKEYMLAWRDVAQTEMMVFRRCKADGAVDLKRQSGNNKATLPVSFSVLLPSGKQPWMWKGIGTKSGPAPLP